MPRNSTSDSKTGGKPRAAKKSRCPLCGKPTETGFRPFCSKRCADIDLARWMNGSYAIPVVEEDGGDSDDGTEGEY